MIHLELHVRTGARSGDVLTVRAPRVTLGRSPEADLRLDPHRDLEVSGLHAELVLRDGIWHVRDLESRNGTWLDGERLTSPAPIRSGSRIRFGAGGPEVEVRALGAEPPPAPPPATVAGPRDRAPSGATPSDRIRALTKRSRALSGTLAVLVVGVLAAGVVVARAWMDRDAEFQRERDALQADMDSLLAANRRAVQSLQGQMEGLARVLRASEAEVRDLRGALDRAEEDGSDASELADLRARLQSATVALTRQQLAASLDFPTIEAANEPAVAMVYVEFAPARVSTGTAFAVRPDGSLVTNRHVVRGEDGRSEPLRIGVQFSNSPQVWPARVVRVAPDADLALIRVDQILGDVPTVAGINAAPDTLPTGSPVALLGFPLGGDDPRESSGRPVPRALLTAGAVQDRRDGVLEILGYGEQGASGSPVLDATGHVVAVLFGGRDQNGTRILVAASSAELLRFLGDDFWTDPGGGGGSPSVSPSGG